MTAPKLITQTIDFGIIHLDPHPGNIGIVNTGKIVFYDFGVILEQMHACVNEWMVRCLVQSFSSSDHIGILNSAQAGRLWGKSAVWKWV